MRSFLRASCVWGLLAASCTSRPSRSPDRPDRPTLAGEARPRAPAASRRLTRIRSRAPTLVARRRPLVIRNVTIMTAAGPTIPNGAVLVRDGKIAAVGATVNAPADATVIDGRGKYVTPGIIDDHSHLGVYAAPGGDALSDGNEATNPVTANVWAEHSVWPQDPQFPRNLAGGVTTLQVLPGSANLIGGRSVVLKVVPVAHRAGDEVSRREVRAEDGVRRESEARLRERAARRRAWATSPAIAPRGSRPRRIGASGTSGTRRSQGRSADARSRARDARRGAARQHPRPQPLLSRRRDGADDRHREGVRLQDPLLPPRRRGVQDRRPAREGRHLARRSGPTGAASRWKRSTRVKANLAIVHARRRARDHALRRSVGIAAPQPGSGEGDGGRQRASAFHVTEDDAIKWMTINPAWALGLDDRIGSIEAGKNADVVLWSGNPFSVYSRAEKVWIDGALLFDRLDPAQRGGAPISSSASCRRRAEARDDAADRTSCCALAAAALALRAGAAPRAQTDRHHRRQGLPGQRAADRERAPCSSQRHASPRSAPTSPCPPARTRIDATGKWVTPGLINACHGLGVVEIGAVPDANDASAKGDRAVAAVVPRLGRPQPARRCCGTRRATKGSPPSVVAPGGGV